MSKPAFKVLKVFHFYQILTYFLQSTRISRLLLFHRSNIHAFGDYLFNQDRDRLAKEVSSFTIYLASLVNISFSEAGSERFRLGFLFVFVICAFFFFFDGVYVTVPMLRHPPQISTSVENLPREKTIHHGLDEYTSISVLVSTERFLPPVNFRLSVLKT